MEGTRRRGIALALRLAPVLSGADAGPILHNGKLLTVDANFPVVQAVAVKDGRIAAAGSNRQVLRERGASTAVVDLKGRTGLPGLIDSHVHPPGAGLSEYRRPLPRIDSFAATPPFLLERAKTTPKGEWIVVPRTFAGGSDHTLGQDRNGATSVTRKATAGTAIRPEQKVGREDALRSHTIHGAALAGAEKAMGSRETGKLADLTTIDRDYMTCTEEEIRDIEPVAVYIGGNKAWSR